MKNIFVLTFIGLCSTHVITALANPVFKSPSEIVALDSPVTVIREKVDVFENSNCRKTDSCDLVRVVHRVNDYKIKVEGVSFYGSKLIAEYETKRVKDLENYAFVMRMRGCTYESEIDASTGDLKKRYNKVVPSFGNDVFYKFPNWGVFSTDVDPMFATNENYPTPRHYLYRWNTVSGSYNNTTELPYGYQKPTTPKLYVTHLPEQAYLTDWGAASNLSMELETCLYKTTDIPTQATRADPIPAAPIVCFPWSNQWQYDFEHMSFLKPKTIDPFCLN